MNNSLRAVALIAHVDHGKTTLVDQLLKQSGTLVERGEESSRVMDSNDLEKERGITILAKNTAIQWQDYKINIVDTPGHADFGGEVERILSMVDSVLLLVDACEGPMPQTRFVTQKAFAHGLKPIVVVNKIDRPGARPDEVIDEVFDLFDSLGATDEQLDFPIIYASAINGFACLEHENPGTDMEPLFEAIIEHVKPLECDETAPLQLQISSLDYSSYVGMIGVGRVHRGTVKRNMNVIVVDREGKQRKAKVLQVMGYLGLERLEVEEGKAGDIIAVSGIDKLTISDTLCDPDCIEPLPALTVDEPTVKMIFQVNTSPFVGREGDFVTGNKLRERLYRECLHNVALRVEDTSDPDKLSVAGRGELHLSILIETMRREGYEFAVSPAHVIMREVDGVQQEPFEKLTVDIEDRHQGSIMEILGARQATLESMLPDGQGRVRLDYTIPARGLIGFHTDYLKLTSGTGIIYHVFDHYGVVRGEITRKRQNGVLIAKAPGVATAYSLFNLQNRGRMFVGPQTDVYEGMIVGLHSRDNDLVVNPTKEKQLTNIRASGSDENIILTPALQMTLEQALSFIEDDELLEVTPKSLRLRKKYLKEHERKRAQNTDKVLPQ